MTGTDATRPQIDPRPLALALTFGLLTLGLLAVLVLTHATSRLDAAVDDWAWAHRGATTDHVLQGVHLLAPTHLFVIIALLAAGWSAHLRSARPLVICLLACACATVPELGLKWTMPRIETLLGGTGAAGFPSGHVVSALCFPGALLLALRPSPRRWQWALVIGCGVAMSGAVLVTAMHTPTEVAGSWALSWCVLTAAGAVAAVRRPLRWG